MGLLLNFLNFTRLSLTVLLRNCREHVSALRQGMQDDLLKRTPSALPAWKGQEAEIRRSLGSKGLMPLMCLPGRTFLGLQQTQRNMTCIDLALLQFLGVDGARNLTKCSQTTAEAMVAELFVDVSQNPCRKAFTNPSNKVSKCLTTSSSLYSCGKDRVVLPLELLFFQGHNADLQIPADMKQDALKELAGEGICLPCLATLVVALVGSGLLTYDRVP